LLGSCSAQNIDHKYGRRRGKTYNLPGWLLLISRRPSVISWWRASSGVGPARKQRQAQHLDACPVGDARGFAIDGERNHLIITAAHCLPSFPPCHPASNAEDRIYKELVGPLGAKPTVWVECLFADPIGDVVLGPPDDQVLPGEWDHYQAFLSGSVPLRIGDPPTSGLGWLLSLNGQWFQCEVRHYGGPLEIVAAADRVVLGMSGSPILASDGTAVGVVCVSAGSPGAEVGFPNPRLTYNLPGWLLLELGLVHSSNSHDR